MRVEKASAEDTELADATHIQFNKGGRFALCCFLGIVVNSIIAGYSEIRD